MSVKRYQPAPFNERCLHASDDGEYVKHEYYAALEARCAALSAENAGLKKFCEDVAFYADYEAELGMERGGFTDGLSLVKTTQTDAFLAEVRAQGVEMFAKAQEKIADEELIGGNFDLSLRFRGMSNAAKKFAAQLRQEEAQ